MLPNENRGQVNRSLECLLVEDELVDVMTVRRAIRRHVLDVDLTVVESAEEAWDHLCALFEGDESSLPDVILADLGLPCSSGLDLLERLKADGRFLHLPYVIFSTSCQASDAARAAASGATGYFVKPLVSEDYADQLEKVFRYVAASEPALAVEARITGPSGGGTAHYLEIELMQQLRDGDQALISFIESRATDGIWYWDLVRNEHEWMSPRFWQTLGYDPASKPHLASAWQDMIDPDDLRVATANLEKHCADSEHAYDQVVRYRHQDGSTVWVHCRGIAIRDPEGRPIRMIGVHTDITKQREAAQAATQLQQKLDAISALVESADEQAGSMGPRDALRRIRALLRA